MDWRLMPNKEDNKKYKILWFLLDFFGISLQSISPLNRWKDHPRMNQYKVETFSNN